MSDSSEEVNGLNSTLKVGVGVAAAATAAALLVGCGAETYKKEVGGGEQTISKVKAGEPMYTPPQGVPGIPGGGAGMPPMAPPPPGGKAP